MCQVSRYINLFTDFGFKKIFGDPDNTDLLKSLLNDILGFANERKIEKIIFKNGELLPEAPEERKAIIDLLCEDENGSQFIVELQKVSQEHFQSRALYYTSFPIQQQGIKGGWNFELTPVYFIGLLNFEIDRFKNKSEYLHHGKIVDIHTNEVMYDKLNMIYLEIPKLKKTKEELSNHLEWWIYVFQNLHMMTDIPKELNSDVIKNTFERAEFASMSKSEQENYHKNLKVYRDLVNSLDFAIKEGLRLGREEGKQEGREEGEKKKSIEIAKNLLDVLDSQTIALKTGLSIEEIERLR
ncbi:MAG: Rpn family recombination-promoting nuclease/putative transposase [Campylobacterota bacterium]|nr:Rpn family recombination-promoting nuclease/putative transposase [Campylobacterota bacterium]